MDLTDPLVSVRGEAVHEVEPEVARLTVTVRSRDKDRDDTLRRLDERSTAVHAVLASFGEAVERTETAGVRISPELKDGKPNERVTGYTAQLRHTVTVVDFGRLGDLVARLAELDQVDVTGPWWQLRTGSAVYREVRMAAARDAVTRAREYAEALGTRLSGLVEIADTGLLGEAAPAGWAGAPPPGAPVAPMAMRPFGGGAGVVTAMIAFDLEPVAQVVRASVEARFRMAPPGPESL
jgi:uncharacterized protein YggE